MFNHVRTLLLNADGASAPGAAVPGEEGVPAGYRAFAPPGWLAAVRAELFGRAPDRLMMNYRLRQYMGLLHATELAEHVLAYDPRVTYDPAAADLAAHPAFGVRAEGSARQIRFAGRYEPDEALGRLAAEWRVSTEAGPAVTVTPVAPAGPAVTTPVAVADGATADVPLGRGLRCYVDPTPGEVWYVAAAARPARGLPEIVAALRDSPRAGEAFGAAAAEPDRTYKALWAGHPALLYRLGGLLLAVARRSDELWRGAA